MICGRLLIGFSVLYFRHTPYLLYDAFLTSHIHSVMSALSGGDWVGGGGGIAGESSC